MKLFLLTLNLFVCIIALNYSGYSQKQDNKLNRCSFWQSEVDSSLTQSDIIIKPKKLTDAEIFTAIDCLLKLEGNKNKALFSGATGLEASSVPQFTAAEVAALYYISFLYYEKFDHASVVALNDGSGEFSTQTAITEAYQSYRKWFEEVKKIGIKKARKRKLDPLAYTKVRWY